MNAVIIKTWGTRLAFIINFVVTFLLFIIAKVSNDLNLVLFFAAGGSLAALATARFAIDLIRDLKISLPATANKGSKNNSTKITKYDN